MKEKYLVQPSWITIKSLYESPTNLILPFVT